MVDGDDVIIAGHARVEVARQMEIEKIPTISLEHLTPDQVRAYRIADNRLTELGSWDNDLLRQELEALDAADFDIELTGFTRETLGQLSSPAGGGDGDADDVPDLPDEPRTQAGDVWIMGRHRLVCGDSTDGDVVARVLDGAKPNLMITDPPYGVEYDPAWRVGVSGAEQGRERRPVEVRSANVTGARSTTTTAATGRDAYALFPGECRVRVERAGAARDRCRVCQLGTPLQAARD